MAIIPSNPSNNADNVTPEFALQRVYSEVSSEIPGAPDCFDLTEAPTLDMQLNIQSKKSEKFADTYAVVLTVTVKATLPQAEQGNDQKALFLIEVKQGGLFTARGFDENSLETFLSIHCPTLLYPYACVHITDLVARGGFMPLHLPPVDFNSMYAQHQANAQNETA